MSPMRDTSSSADLQGAAVFVQVVESGSIRGAARALAMPKSNVSRRVAELEAQLGARLLQRTTRTLSLTDAGRAFHQHASIAVAALQDAERAVHDLEGEPRGTLKVTAPANFGMLFMPTLIADFMRAYPDVNLVVDFTDRSVDLVQEGFDVAVRAGRLADSSLIAVSLRGSTFATLASPEYLKKHGTPKTPADLRNHECLIFGLSREAKWPYRQTAKSQAKPLEIPVRGKLAANSFFAARDAAIAGLGIARIPELIASDALQTGQLKAVLKNHAMPEAPLHIVYPSHRHLSPKVRVFVDFFTKAFREEPNLFSMNPRRRADLGQV